MENVSNLPESRLYTFFHPKEGLTIHFLEGQKLIYELAITHAIKGAGFAYFRDVIISIQPMISLLKGGEWFGVYIDSEEPYFRLKIEANANGLMRCLLLPEDFHEFPESLVGKVRVLKLFPNDNTPYQSILELNHTPLKEIVNQILTDSYQVNSTTLVAENADQSLLLHRLPAEYQVNREIEKDQEALRLYLGENKDKFKAIFDRCLVDPMEIQQAFAEMGYQLLKGIDVKFQCNCSKERMLMNIKKLSQEDQDYLFEDGRSYLDTNCEYCKKTYVLTREDLNNFVSPYS